MNIDQKYRNIDQNCEIDTTYGPSPDTDGRGNPVTDQKAQVEEKSKSGASRENEDKKLENVKIIIHEHFKKP